MALTGNHPSLAPEAVLREGVGSISIVFASRPHLLPIINTETSQTGVNWVSPHRGRAEESFRPKAASTSGKRRLLERRLTALSGAKERPRSSTEGREKSRK